MLTDMRYYIITIVLSSLILGEAGENQKGFCGSIDIRAGFNWKSEDFKDWHNCRISEGNVKIAIMNEDKFKAEHFLPLSNLTHITGFLLIYQCKHLDSVGRMFPNLRVIGGREKLMDYSLIIVDNPNLKDIGLNNLTEITSGGVRIAQNPNLCYANTVNWTRLYGDTSAVTTIRHNKLNSNIECNSECAPENEAGCLRNESLPARPLLCWNEKHCQRDCPFESGCYGPVDALLPCHSHCKGGCTGPRSHQCHACRYVHHKGNCLHKCPPNFYLFMDRLCLSKKECGQRRGMNQMNKNTNYHPIEWEDPNINGTERVRKVCSLDCPPDTKEDESDPTICVKCRERCPKVCKGGTEAIRFLNEAYKYKGCNVIDGNLEMNLLKDYKSNIGSKLEGVFSDLQEVTGKLIINFSPSITSLNMFTNLRVIGRDAAHQSSKGATENVTKTETLYSLVIVDNRDLIRLFPDPSKLRIEHGSVRIANNEKLCARLVDSFIAEVNFSNPAKQRPAPGESYSKSNGANAICEMDELELISIKSVMWSMVMVSWAEFNETNTDHRMFMGYRVNYKKVDHPDPSKVDIYADRDDCHDSWTSKYVSKEHRGDVISDLKPYTYYAVYISTYLINAPGARGAQTKVHVIRTQFGKPSIVRDVHVDALAHDKLLVTWNPPQYRRGLITYYTVRYKEEKDSLGEGKNYCPKTKAVEHEADEPSDTESEAPPADTRTFGQKSYISMQEHEDACAECGCCICPEEKDGRPKVATKNEGPQPQMVEEKSAFEDAIINTIFVQSCRTKPLPDHCKHTSKGRVRRENNSGDEDMMEYFLMEDVDDLVHHLPGFKSLEEEGRKKREISEFELELEMEEGDTYKEAEETQREITEWIRASDVDWNVVNVTNTTFILDDLNHYTSYVFAISACQDPEEKQTYCSNKTNYLHARTEPIPSNDRISAEDITVSIDANATDAHPRSRVVSWVPPPNPNGPITHYLIEYQIVDSKQAQISKCISVTDFMANNNSTILHDIHPGNYSLRLQAVTLLAENGGPAMWSVPVYFNIESIPLLPTHVLVLLAILIPITFVLLCAAMFWFIQHRFKKQLPNYVMNMISSNPDYISSLEVYNKDEWELERESVQMLHEIGRGTFGTVYLGQGNNVQSVNGVTFGPCAIKTVAENANHFDRLTFLVEASVMKQFSSPHIVKLYGVVSDGQPALVVMEMMHLGNLRDYLRSRRPDCEENVHDLPPPSCSECLLWAAQIADGMAYLESIKFCHRDLAARNCMVSEDRICKIGDFGMARDVYVKDYYKPTGKRLMPVRWMAPESLRDAKFNSKSDVWSYGVVLWEMASLAQQPYMGLDNEKVVEYVKDARQTLRMPTDCPSVLAELMQPCWKYEPRQRPTFADMVVNLLNQLKDVHEADQFRQVSFIANGGANGVYHCRRKASPQLSAEHVDSDSPLNPDDSPPVIIDDIHQMEMRSVPVPVCANNRRIPKSFSSATWKNRNGDTDNMAMSSCPDVANGCVSLTNGHVNTPMAAV